MKLRLLMAAFSCMLFINAQSQSIGLIGSATPGGWDVDTNMVQDVDSAHLWTLEITLIDGAAKFRQDDDWVVNWGPEDGEMNFPSGLGVQDGGDIFVFAGDYLVSFNSNTGEYNFDVDSDIGIIGDATAGGWDVDTDMYKDQTDSNKFFVRLDLVEGAAKFRKDDDWIVNWGPAVDSMAFPSGVGIQDGENIPIPNAGNFMITLDTSTGEYLFEEDVTYASIGIIGDATAGGWDTDTDLVKDGELWKGNIDLGNGEIKFRANDDWAVSWGGPAEFPMDTAILGSNDNIAVDSGTYLVTFDTESGAFSFLPIVFYESIGIIGDAADGWDVERAMALSEGDSSQWQLRTILKDGELKFRANNDWDVASWGGAEFPTGVAGNPGVNIPITAGEYVIDFNTTTGAYHFQELVVFDTVGLIGTGTSFGDWDNDVYMDKDADDEQLWTLTTDLVEGEVKFRAESDWTVNWGPEELGGWSSGVGIQDGQNIQTVAGTYMISLRSDDGSYGFQEPSSLSESILKQVKVYPNPAHSSINIELNTQDIQGLIRVQIIDVNGRVVINSKEQARNVMSINVSNLLPGNYFVKMNNEKFLMAKPISIVR